MKPQTIAARAAGAVDPATGAVTPSIQPATTYRRRADYTLTGPEYTRDGNPGYAPVERVLSELEGGADALLFASGMAAADAVLHAYTAAGDRIVASRAMYHAFRRRLTEVAPRMGLRVDFVDTSDTDALAAAVRAAPTALVYIETPANPTWEVTDIAAAAALAAEAGARLVVDSTAATPVHTRPLALGAHVVLHAATKYLNGHSDVLAGALIAARDDDAWARARAHRRGAGAVPGPFEAWLLLRGLRTLYVRVQRQSAAAATLAARLAAHPAVARVLYPGLADHPGHDAAARQMEGGFGGMLSIRVRGGAGAALRAAGRTALWLPATSLGGVESLIEHRATVEGAFGLAPPDLLRLSVGLEDVDELYDDLAAALSA